MSLYSERLMDAVKNMTGNAPIKTTSTTTMKGNEGLDIGSLMMMLLMGQMFKKPTATEADTINPMSILGAMGSGGGFQGGITPVQGAAVPQYNAGVTGASQLNSIEQLLNLLGKINPLFNR